jgi:hypothetical protein
MLDDRFCTQLPLQHYPVVNAQRQGTHPTGSLPQTYPLSLLYLNSSLRNSLRRPTDDLRGNSRNEIKPGKMALENLLSRGVTT